MFLAIGGYHIHIYTSTKYVNNGSTLFPCLPNDFTKLFHIIPCTIPKNLQIYSTTFKGSSFLKTSLKRVVDPARCYGGTALKNRTICKCSWSVCIIKTA